VNGCLDQLRLGRSFAELDLPLSYPFDCAAAPAAVPCALNLVVDCTGPFEIFVVCCHYTGFCAPETVQLEVRDICRQPIISSPTRSPAMAPSTSIDDPRMSSIKPRLKYNTIGGVNGPLVILDNVRTPIHTHAFAVEQHANDVDYRSSSPDSTRLSA
jgi:hypothetical protein